MIIKVLGSSPTLDASPNGPKHNTRSNGPKEGVAAPWQIMDANLFRRFPLISKRFWCETTWIDFLIKLSFHPYVDRRKQSPDASWVTSLRQTQTWVALGLHLGDSNWISLRPPSWLGHPCWPPTPLYHVPNMVICMGVMCNTSGV